MKMSMAWALPNGRTFEVKPIAKLIGRYIQDESAAIIVDPFANNEKFATITNDLDPRFNTQYHMDALDFLKTLPDGIADMVLYDPPYSLLQVAGNGNIQDKTVKVTRASYWSRLKGEIARVLKMNGICISCGWNSNGIGKKRGFEKVEVLLWAHGSNHKDTIVTVERKKEEVE